MTLVYTPSGPSASSVDFGTTFAPEVVTQYATGPWPVHGSLALAPPLGNMMDDTWPLVDLNISEVVQTPQRPVDISQGMEDVIVEDTR